MAVPKARPAQPAEADLVAALLDVYRQGLFPMADPDSGAVDLYTADPRAILPIDAPPGAPGGVRVSRSLRAAVRRQRFVITSDTAFEAVIRACAKPRGEGDGQWLSEEMIGWYLALHRAGHAHSVEAWLAEPAGDPDRHAPSRGAPALVGGLYGVHIGSAFFGESMFSRPDLGGTDASKVCLVHLIHHLRARGFTLLDSQYTNDHIQRFGPDEIPRPAYLQRLAAAVACPAAWTPFEPSAGARE